MTEPIFWLACSLFLVAVSLTAVLIAAIPALQELARAARSAEKLFDTLRRDFPPTLEAIRLTGLEISELTDDLNDGVKNASDIVRRVDQSLGSAREQIGKVHQSSQGVVAGVRAAWQTWQRYPSQRPDSQHYNPPQPDLYPHSEPPEPRKRYLEEDH